MNKKVVFFVLFLLVVPLVVSQGFLSTPPPDCIDGTPPGQCSADQTKYCTSSGVLVPAGVYMKGDGDGNRQINSFDFDKIFLLMEGKNATCKDIYGCKVDCADVFDFGGDSLIDPSDFTMIHNLVNTPINCSPTWVCDDFIQRFHCAYKCSICPDGTQFNTCSPAKPLFCGSEGVFVNSCEHCGCPPGTECSSDLSCVPILKCTDNTTYGECSDEKPKFCSEGIIIDNCALCGCPAGMGCSSDLSCKELCSDGTFNGECSINKPKFCSEGTLVDNCTKCSCPVGSSCTTEGTCVSSVQPCYGQDCYKDKDVFLISNQNWKEVLQLVPVAVWTDGSGKVHQYPMLIYYEEEQAFDADSTIYFLQQYMTKNLTIIGETDQELDNLLIAPLDLGAGLTEQQIRRIYPEDIILFFGPYDTVVYVEDDYELALLASTYASLTHSPLIVKGSSLDLPENIDGKNIICVGSPLGVTCDEQYDLDQLRQKYFDETNTDKFILINPDDAQKRCCEGTSPMDSPFIIENMYNHTFDGVITIKISDPYPGSTTIADPEIAYIRTSIDEFNFWEDRTTHNYMESGEIVDGTNYCPEDRSIRIGNMSSGGGYVQVDLEVPYFSYNLDLWIYDGRYKDGDLEQLNCYRGSSYILEVDGVPISAPDGGEHFPVRCSCRYDHFHPERSGSYLNDLHKWNSMAAPILASAKHELILSVPSDDYLEIDAFIENKLTQYGVTEGYLTIIAAPNVIPVTGSLFDGYYNLDQITYSRLDQYLGSDLAVGRIMGLTLSDVSSYIARDLFHREIPAGDTALFIAKSFPHLIYKTEKLSSLFRNQSYDSYCGIQPEGEYGPDTDCNQDFGPWDWADKGHINYQDHGTWSGDGITYFQLPYLSNSIMFSFSCSTCQKYLKASYCNNAIRKGALAYFGALRITWVSNININSLTLDHIYYQNQSVGQALKEHPIADFILVGDPTFKPDLKHIFNESIFDAVR